MLIRFFLLITVNNKEVTIIRIRRGKAKRKVEVPKERINDQIDASSVRLIGSDGKQIGIVDTRAARKRAEAENLDLVEISSSADPPVCKIMAFGKYYYHKEKGVREAKKKQHVVQLKEIKMGPNTDDHDYDFKKKNAIRFFTQGNKVKFTIRFKGRQITHKELGYELLDSLQQDLADYAEVDVQPTNEARAISMIMAPKKEIIIVAQASKEPEKTSGEQPVATSPAQPKENNNTSEKED